MSKCGPNFEHLGQAIKKNLNIESKKIYKFLKDENNDIISRKYRGIKGINLVTINERY